jgi:hypothetical protein
MALKSTLNGRLPNPQLDILARAGINANPQTLRWPMLNLDPD